MSVSHSILGEEHLDIYYFLFYYWGFSSFSDALVLQFSCPYLELYYILPLTDQTQISTTHIPKHCVLVILELLKQ